MKKLLLMLFCIMHCALCIDVKAQDDAESIVSGDIEVEGLDNFWVESRLVTLTPSASLVPLRQGDNSGGAKGQDGNIGASLKPARPAGGNIAFLTHVQKYMSKVFNILFEKYPEEMLGRMGMHTEVHIEFTVTKDAEIQLDSISNGAIFGIDVVVAEKLLESYKKRWTPARVNGEAVDSRMELVIDVSI